MKVLYCAAHHNGGNDDEGAIAYGLERLGHTVVKVSQLADPLVIKSIEADCDFALFHKVRNSELLSVLTIPKVIWYFDLVEWPDLSLRKRNRERVAWMEEMAPKADLVFCTDGDWVAKVQSDKFIRLSQGADERFVGRLLPSPYVPNREILFTGIEARGGTERASFVQFLRERYGEKFYHVTSGVHQINLKQLIANSKIVVAPDSPVTDSYWSNRVYLMLGFGAFLFHPYCEELAKDYEQGIDILLYSCREELEDLIDYYLQEPETEIGNIRESGLQKTMEKHLYRHRLETLIATVKERCCR